MVSPPNGQGARKHVTRRASSTTLSPPHGQGVTIRQFGPTQRATLSTQRTTVKWLLLLGLVTIAVARPNPTIERMKRASVQMHTYIPRRLVSKAELVASRRRLPGLSAMSRKVVAGETVEYKCTTTFGCIKKYESGIPQGKEVRSKKTGSVSCPGCKAPAVPKRRRMAQREFSSRRDSPVMVRLLQEIVRANQP